MTRQEFDALTKRNHGGPLAPSERNAYRDLRERRYRGCDIVAARLTATRSQRATTTAWRRHHHFPLLHAAPVLPATMMPPVRLP
jgi:hypothetical protein